MVTFLSPFQTLQHSWATCGVTVALSECASDMSRHFCSVKLRAYSQRPCSPSHSEAAWKTWSEMRLIRSTGNNWGMKDTYELPLDKTSGQKKLSHVKLLCVALCAAKWPKYQEYQKGLLISMVRRNKMITDFLINILHMVNKYRWKKASVCKLENYPG